MKINLFIALIIGACIIFMYPQPLYTWDSGGYILDAITGNTSGFRPIGYSWFLSLFHSISSNINAITIFQYLLHALASLFFIYTSKVKLGVKNYLLLGILILTEINILYLTTLIMSDSIFVSLTMLYIATLFWIKDNWKWFLVHIIILFIALNVRYTAIFYPIVSMIFLWKSPRMVIPLLVAVGFYFFTKNKMEEDIGYKTFSGFGGWAIANNAVSVIPYTKSRFTDPNLKYIHSVIEAYPDSVYSKEKIIATSFMWSPKLPGKQILYSYLNNSKKSYSYGFNYIGDLYKEYGIALIKKHPIEYIKRFIIPNILQIFKFYEPKYDQFLGKCSVCPDWYGEYTVKERTGFIAKLNLINILFMLLKLGLLIYGIIYGDRKLIIFILLFLAFSVTSHPINNWRYLIPLYPVIYLLGISKIKFKTKL